MQINGHLVKTMTDCHKHILAGSFKAVDLANKCWENV